MRKILIILATTLAFAATPAQADEAVMQGADFVLTLKQSACADDKAMAHVLPAYRSQVKTATVAMNDGTTLAACWAPLDGTIQTIDENGRLKIWSPDHFKRKPNA